jgi:hypothetical protein
VGSDHRRWLLLNALLITAVINVALNALIAWLSALGHDSIPLWAAPLVGGPSTITDTLGTLFILPFVTTLVITTVVWHEDLPALRGTPVARAFVAFLPGRVARGAVFGAACFSLLALPSVLVLVATDFGDISVGTFVLYKAVFGLVFGALVTPVIAACAMVRRA